MKSDIQCHPGHSVINHYLVILSVVGGNVKMKKRTHYRIR